MERQALPVLVLSGWDRDENAASATVLMDPEGNGPGHLELSTREGRTVQSGPVFTLIQQ